MAAGCNRTGTGRETVAAFNCYFSVGVATGGAGGERTVNAIVKNRFLCQSLSAVSHFCNAKTTFPKKVP